jgi:hypothetical protein
MFLCQSSGVMAQFWNPFAVVSVSSLIFFCDFIYIVVHFYCLCAHDSTCASDFAFTDANKVFCGCLFVG